MEHSMIITCSRGFPMLYFARDMAAFGVLVLFGLSLVVWMDVIARMG